MLHAHLRHQSLWCDVRYLWDVFARSLEMMGRLAVETRELQSRASDAEQVRIGSWSPGGKGTEKAVLESCGNDYLKCKGTKVEALPGTGFGKIALGQRATSVRQVEKAEVLKSFNSFPAHQWWERSRRGYKPCKVNPPSSTCVRWLLGPGGGQSPRFFGYDWAGSALGVKWPLSHGGRTCVSALGWDGSSIFLSPYRGDCLLGACVFQG